MDNSSFNFLFWGFFIGVILSMIIYSQTIEEQEDCNVLEDWPDCVCPEPKIYECPNCVDTLIDKWDETDKERYIINQSLK